jgi:hypothetical protein
MDHSIIEGERLTNVQLANKLNVYYKSVGGVAVHPSTTATTGLYKSTPLQPLSIGEGTRLLYKLDPSKATSCNDFPTWISKEGAEDIMHTIT